MNFKSSIKDTTKGGVSMFCKIRKGKWSYTIYACSRERVNGKVVSKDIKLCSLAWHSLYEIDEEINGLIEDVPVDLMRIINKVYLRNKDVELDFDDVVEKLIIAKKEYYPTYKEQSIKAHRKFEEEKELKKEKELMEYEYFKNKFSSLYNKELTEKYQEGYNRGLLENLMNSSGKNNSYNSKEMKLLKEAFKLLSMKYHPDKNLDKDTTEIMAAINNLKEKILK